MTRSDDRARRVIGLCEEFISFLGELSPPKAVPFYVQRIGELRADPGFAERRRIYRRIYKATNTGAGGYSDLYVVGEDGAGDVERTNAYYRCLKSLLKATYTFP